jgi:hypothetical protein
MQLIQQPSPPAASLQCCIRQHTCKHHRPEHHTSKSRHLPGELQVPTSSLTKVLCGHHTQLPHTTNPTNGPGPPSHQAQPPAPNNTVTPPCHNIPCLLDLSHTSPACPHTQTPPQTTTTCRTPQHCCPHALTGPPPP